MAKRKANKNSAAKRPVLDAIGLLKADHRQVEEWFAAFEKTKSDAKRLDSKVKVLSEMIKHHVKEEEHLAALGAQLAARKKELMVGES
jgi:hypothetical protein